MWLRLRLTLLVSLLWSVWFVSCEKNQDEVHDGKQKNSTIENERLIPSGIRVSFAN